MWRVARGAWRVARGAWRAARGAWRGARGVGRVARGAWRVACGVWRYQAVLEADASLGVALTVAAVTVAHHVLELDAILLERLRRDAVEAVLRLHLPQLRGVVGAARVLQRPIEGLEILGPLLSVLRAVAVLEVRHDGDGRALLVGHRRLLKAGAVELCQHVGLVGEGLEQLALEAGREQQHVEPIKLVEAAYRHPHLDLDP